MQSESGWKCTKETRLHVLHSKILHSIYPTIISLKRIGIAESKYCKHCKNDIDYIERFFQYCKNIYTIWKQVEEYLRYDTQIKLKLMDSPLGYSGMENNTGVQLATNHVILIAKMCILLSMTQTLISCSYLNGQWIREKHNKPEKKKEEGKSLVPK